MPLEIDISQLSASELDELLAKAAARRAIVEPAHPTEVPKPDKAIVNRQWFTCLVEPGSLFQIRHPGYGWLAFVIPPNERAQLLSLLLNQALLTPQSQSSATAPSVSGGTTVH